MAIHMRLEGITDNVGSLNDAHSGEISRRDMLHLMTEINESMKSFNSLTTQGREGATALLMENPHTRGMMERFEVGSYGSNHRFDAHSNIVATS